MKINLPVFKDQDKKDAITYQSWHWDLTLYCCAGMLRLHALLPFVIHSPHGYPGELVRSLGTDVTLDGILALYWMNITVIVKALDALNQELFQLQMGKKETVSEMGVHLSRHLQILMTLFPECFLPASCS